MFSLPDECELARTEIAGAVIPLEVVSLRFGSAERLGE